MQHDEDMVVVYTYLEITITRESKSVTGHRKDQRKKEKHYKNNNIWLLTKQDNKMGTSSRR